MKGVTVAGTGTQAQVYLLDPENPNVGAVNVTGNLGGMNKFNPYLFFNTNSDTGALQTNMVVFKHQTSAGNMVLMVYAQNPNNLQWGHYQTITYRNLRNPEDGSDETDRPYLLSPEAFTTSGPQGTRTWLLFSSSDNMMVADGSDGNIWAALVQPTDPNPGTTPVTGLRLNDRYDNGSGDSSAIRAEGEVYFTDSASPVIYYSQQRRDGLDFGCPLAPGGVNANWMLKRVTDIGSALDAL